MSDQDTTITADGLAQMLEQFKGSGNLRLLASSYLDQAQAFEDAVWPLLNERSLANATGDRLDGIGEIFDTPRGGQNDADYRLTLQTEIGVLLSRGTEADLLTIAQLLIQMTTPDYEFTEYFPKSLYLRPVDFPLAPEPISEWFYDSGTSGADEYVRVHDETLSSFDIWIGQNDADSVAQNTALNAIESEDYIRIMRLDDGSFFDAWVSTAHGDEGAYFRFTCTGDSESSGFAWPSDDTRMSVVRVAYGDYTTVRAIATALQRAASAGTNFLFVYSTYDDGDTFTLSSLPTTVQTSTALGLSQNTRDTGGHLSGAP